MNHLHFGDNLRVLRESIRDESVDLVYLDPPFNSNASYNVLFRSPEGVQSGAQIEAFEPRVARPKRRTPRTQICAVPPVLPRPTREDQPGNLTARR